MTSTQIAAEAAPIFAGMKLYELLTLLGIILGPIAAVAITLGYERHRKTRDARMQVLRQLISTYKFAGDPNWTVGVNMVLVEFGNVKRVRDARKAYVEWAYTPIVVGSEGAHGAQMMTRQTALIYEVARALGFKLTEGELSTQVYAAGGLMNRDALYVDSLRAMRDLADSMKRSADAVERMIGSIAAQADVPKKQLPRPRGKLAAMRSKPPPPG
jgi:hypothetical protein